MLRRILTPLVMILMVLVLLPTAVSAQSAADIQSIFGDSVFYDPESGDAASVCIAGTPGISISGSSAVLSGDPLALHFPSGVDDAAMATAITSFIQKASPSSPWLKITNFGNRFVAETKSRDVNPMLIVVIGRQESSIGTSQVATRNNNSFGNKGNGPGGYRLWPSFEASLFGEDSFTAAVQDRLNGGHSNYVNVKTMYEYLSVHVSGQIIYRGDSTSVYDDIMGISVNYEGVEAYFKHAEEWISEMTGLQISGLPTRPSGAAVAGVSGCSSGGSIVDLALKYSWYENGKVASILTALSKTNNLCVMQDNPSACGQTVKDAGGMITEADAKPEYVTAVKTYNTGNDSDGANWAFSDCGVFVATVLRASNTDSSYAARGTDIQLAYVQAHPEKYDVVPFTDTSQAQPGDWFITDGHTYIYVGPNQLTQQEVADASWGDHVPIVNGKLVIGDGYYRVRKL